MTSRTKDPWGEQVSRGYCYHSAIRHSKTETLVRKLREEATPKSLATIAYELSLRDPALALAEVKNLAADPAFARRKKVMRLCLHHVADVDTARTLFDAEGFDPDALHLAPFQALLDDFVERLPGLDATRAEAQLRKLGFLAGPVPNPIVDGPADSEAAATSPARFDACVVRFLTSVFVSPSLAHVRPELAEHLRKTYAPEAYLFLVARRVAGELAAVEAIAAIPRVGHAQLSARVGAARVDDLVRAFVDELRAPAAASRFERHALENGWLPGSAKDLPFDHARAVAVAFLDAPRFSDLHAAAAGVLLEGVHDGARIVLDHAATLDENVCAEAARRLPYADARARLVAAGVAPDHPALVRHPDAPPDTTLVAKARARVDADPAKSLQILADVARDPKHPHAEEAFTAILDLAGPGAAARARRHALYQLGEIGDARAAPVVRAALADASMDDARILIETALRRLEG